MLKIKDNVDLRQGDCLEVMKDIPDKSVDMILCDLPYGTTACKWDNVIPFEPLWEQYNRIIKDNGAIVLFGSQPFTSMLISSNIKNFKYEWIWEKQKASNFMGAKYQPMKYHENILVFGKSRVNYNPIMWKCDESKIDKRKTINQPKYSKEIHYGNINGSRKKDNGLRYPKSILKFDRSVNNNLHPTQKPVELLEYLIKTYTNENNIVLDNCMGSGSTGVACINTNRNFIGIELDENYFNIAKERIEKVGGESE